MKGTLLASEALANHFRVLVDEDAHLRSLAVKTMLNRQGAKNAKDD
jgi:hypothetical protein